MEIDIDFIGIGFPKTATSWIHQCLGEHPNICVAQPKETRYFASQGLLYNQDSFEDIYQPDLTGYSDFFSHCTGEQIRGEFDTNYIYDKTALTRIHNHFPDINIIISVRNPYERAISQYKHIASKNKSGYDYTDFSEALGDYEFMHLNKYSAHLQKVFSVFHKEQIYTLNFDTIKASPTTAIHEIYDFLEVDYNFTPAAAQEKHNSSATRRSAVMNMFFRTHNIVSTLPMGKKVIQAVKTTGINSQSLANLVNTFSSQDRSFQFPAKKKKEINSEIAKTEELLGWDLKNWKRSIE
jgi:hypothetical protein